MTVSDTRKSVSMAKSTVQIERECEVGATCYDDVFPVGSSVRIETVIGTKYSGQVVCYDLPTKLLVIKDTSGKKPLLRYINLTFIRQASNTGDKPSDYMPFRPSAATPQQIEKRMRRAEARKKASIMQADIPIAGQLAFINIRKTLEDVKWEGENINVLGRVLIRPPYTVESLEPIGDASNTHVAQARDHVHKILSKHRQHQSTQRNINDDAPADPTPSI